MLLLLDGLGVKKDLLLCVYYVYIITLAAQAKYPLVMHSLACLFEMGFEGISQDQNRALVLYIQAVDMDCASSHENFAVSITATRILTVNTYK